MNAPVKDKPRGFAALLQSYASDLKGWGVRLATGYGIAAALLAGGILALFAAIAVGAGALFHIIRSYYGIDIAFAALGGGLFVLALILFLSGWLVMRRRVAPLPRPHRQAQAARRMLAATTMSRAVTALRSDAARPDAMTQVLLGTAAILAAGWIVITHFGSRKPGPEARR